MDYIYCFFESLVSAGSFVFSLLGNNLLASVGLGTVIATNRSAEFQKRKYLHQHKAAALHALQTAINSQVNASNSRGKCLSLYSKEFSMCETKATSSLESKFLALPEQEKDAEIWTETIREFIKVCPKYENLTSDYDREENVYGKALNDIFVFYSAATWKKVRNGLDEREKFFSKLSRSSTLYKKNKEWHDQGKIKSEAANEVLLRLKEELDQTFDNLWIPKCLKRWKVKIWWTARSKRRAEDKPKQTDS